MTDKQKWIDFMTDQGVEFEFNAKHTFADENDMVIWGGFDGFFFAVEFDADGNKTEHGSYEI
jgi:hypothetical protein